MRVSGAASGIALAVLATACFATLDSSTKYAGASIPLFMAIWFRYAFQAAASTALILPTRGFAALRTAHPRFQCLRGLLLLLTSVFAFFSLRHMPVGEFTAIVMVTPLAITLLAATVLKERVSGLRWALVAGGFAGTLLVMRPGGQAFQWAMLLPLGLVACNAWFQVLTSRLAQTEDPITMQFYSGWVGTLITSVFLPLVWTPPPHAAVWGALLLMGVMGTAGHLLLTIAYRRAPASTLMPFVYAQIGFAMLGGWLLFDHVPDATAVAGMVTIALCGAAGAWLTVRESRIVVQPAES
ncbi:DMT family transporter [uncultured Xylophilus sp.]|uniref:DMT family transporter n=1 Tax=uncultured Xylophilus sp. TaxID=296832 RepID=UPI0025D049C9|nr:DMT family transporter [uncultured Xylophilus sp.]